MKKIIAILGITILAMINLFSTEPPNPEGKKLFDQHCGACHHYSEPMTGPPITFISDYKDFEWFVSFKRNPMQFYRTDVDRYTRLMLDHYNPIYGIDPPVDLSDEELRHIWDFLLDLKTRTVKDEETDSLRQSWIK